MLAFVEFYRPMYILLENVFGILCHNQKTTSRKNGIQYAVVKFIQRALASIGYVGLLSPVYQDTV
jgi:DNA (cytosine-5)-methyltransferase 1